jgi:hypothetical protein
MSKTIDEIRAELKASNDPHLRALALLDHDRLAKLADWIRSLEQKGKNMDGDMIDCDMCGTPIDARNTPQWHELTNHGFLCEPCQERIDEDDQ